jgi:GTP cyclohydrolase II
MDYLTRFLGAQATITSRKWGRLTMESASFSPAADGDLVVTIGKPFEQKIPLVRVHSECVFAEVFDSELCDCADQLTLAMARLTDNGHGVLFYLRFDGRGAGLAAKVKATALEVEGMDTYESRVHIGVEPEGRDFFRVGEYLKRHDVRRIKLLTNNPTKGIDIAKAGVDVECEPLLVTSPSAAVKRLYETKAIKFGHSIPNTLRE